MASERRDFGQVRLRLLSRRSDLLTRQRRVEQDLGRRNEPLSGDSSDAAIQLQNDEPLQAIGVAALTEVAAIDAAVARLEQGLYGVCKRCGGHIESARLEAVPYAVTCAACTDA